MRQTESSRRERKEKEKEGEDETEGGKEGGRNPNISGWHQSAW